MKKPAVKKAIKIVAGIVTVLFVLVLIQLLLGYGRVYETNRIEDYGKIVGNLDNEKPAAFIHSFFPDEIEDCFSDVTYHYKAKKGDVYAYECYLEFVIEDPKEYAAFVAEYISQDDVLPFAYDMKFREQTISNVLCLNEIPEDKTYSIGTAELGKILYSDQEQRIIFVALGMFDGGGMTTEELCRFFSRFNIDPWEYAKTAFASGYYQDLGITNTELFGLN